MFRFAKDGCVRWPLSIQQVQPDGSIADQSFIVTYLRLTPDERTQRDTDVAAYLKQFRDLLVDDNNGQDAERAALVAARKKQDDQLLRDRVKDWSGIGDQDGVTLPFSADLLDAFIADELLRNTLLQGLVNASTGAKSKNSLPGLAGLPVPAQA